MKRFIFKKRKINTESEKPSQSNRGSVDAPPENGAMKRVCALIVDGRFVFFVLFAVLAVYCALSLNKVKINDDLTAFLPPEAETRVGIKVMEKEFTTYASAEIMVSNITYAGAEEIKGKILAVDHVTGVTFDDTAAHYKDAAALFSVSFDGSAEEEGPKIAMDRIREVLSDYDVYVSSAVGRDYQKKLAGEMGWLLALAAAVIVAVLLFTSKSYFEVVVFAVVFAISALLNMGTNYLLGEISSITNSIAVIMQLALAIDYAIIFTRRYQTEAPLAQNARQALINALSKSIIEISSSSLTTIAGLAALTLMQFRLGYDLGIVLAKGIVCSMTTVFLLMPGLIMLFPRALKRTEHRSFVPNIEKWGKLLTMKVPVFLILFALILPGAVYFSSKTEYAFSDGAVSEIVYSEERAAMHKIHDTFEPSTALALIVPSGSFQNEKEILEKVSRFDGIKNAVGLANIEVAENRVLTDLYTPRMLSELLNVDIETANLIFRGYGVENKEYGAALDPATAEVPLVDVILYLFEKIDQGMVSLPEAEQSRMDELRGPLERAVLQLRGKEYDRMIFTSSLPAEGEESVALAERVREAAEEYYGKGSVLIAGGITSARDLRNSYRSDSLLISVLTIVFVFIILLFTFRSPVTAALLVFVIQGSIWINFTIPFLAGTHSLFVTNMIVSAIQMGATIDYAIVMMNHYRTNRALMTKKEAMIKAVNESFPTVLTSGAIMTVAGLLIGYRISDVYVSHIGLAVGRGALISVILVLTVLPQLILLFDKVIEKTTLRTDHTGGDEKQ